MKISMALSLVAIAFLEGADAAGNEEQVIIETVSAVSQDTTERVTYQCTFRNLWTKERQPKNYPTNFARWTGPIMWTHTLQFIHLQPNYPSPRGVEKLAEDGYTDILIEEMQSQGEAVWAWSEDAAGGFDTNQKNFVHLPPLETNKVYSYMSVMAGMSPSPDWYTGWYAFWLVNEYSRTYYDHIKIQTYPWDAGTDAGETYLSMSEDLDPPLVNKKFTKNDAPPGGELRATNGDVPPVAEWECFLNIGDQDFILPDCDYFANPCCNETDKETCGRTLPNGGLPEITPEYAGVLENSATGGPGAGGNPGGNETDSNSENPGQNDNSPSTYTPAGNGTDPDDSGHGPGAGGNGFDPDSGGPGASGNGTDPGPGPGNSDGYGTELGGNGTHLGGGGTNAPTITASIPDTLGMVYSIVEIGFYDEWNLREPTDDEAKELICKTNLFYRDEIRNFTGNANIQSEATTINWVWDHAVEPFPFVISFTSNVTVAFEEPVDGQVVYDAMKVDTPGILSYIKNYLWALPTGNPFLEANKANFTNERYMRVPIGKLTTYQCPTTQAPSMMPSVSSRPTSSGPPSFIPTASALPTSSFAPSLAPSVSPAPSPSHMDITAPPALGGGGGTLGGPTKTAPLFPTFSSIPTTSAAPTNSPTVSAAPTITPRPSLPGGGYPGEGGPGGSGSGGGGVGGDGAKRQRITFRYYVSNNLDITKPSEANASGLPDAWPVFASRVVTNITNAGNRRRLRSGGRQLQVGLEPGTATIDELINAACPRGAKANTVCMNATSSYILLLRGDEYAAAVEQEYGSGTITAVDDGSYQAVLDEVRPDSPLTIGIGGTDPDSDNPGPDDYSTGTGPTSAPGGNGTDHDGPGPEPGAGRVIIETVSTVSQDTSERVTYQCTFRNLWTKERQPKNYPTNFARWTGPILWTHTLQFIHLQPNYPSPRGVEKLAEDGYTDILIEEMQSQGEAVLAWSEDAAGGFNTNQKDFVHLPPLETNKVYSYMSVMAGMSPSPDWYTGWYAFWLVDDYSRTYYDHIKIQTYPWDAGTDAGETYLSLDQDLDPPLVNKKFTKNDAPQGGELRAPNGDVPPVAEWECFLNIGDQDLILPACDYFANPCCNETDKENCGRTLPNGKLPEITPEYAGVLANMVYSIVEIGFFEDWNLREPTDDEVKELICKTNLFYRDEIRNFTGNANIQSEATNIDWVWDRAVEPYPFVMSFTSNVTVAFEEPVDGQVVYDAMETPSILSYIENYLQAVPTGNPFLQSNKANFTNERNMRVPIGKLTTYQCPTTQAPSLMPSVSSESPPTSQWLLILIILLAPLCCF